MSNESRAASPDQDFLKLLDELERTCGNLEYNRYDDEYIEAHRAARQSVVDYVAKRHQCYVEVLEEYKASEAELSALREESERLRRFETYVCQVIAMGNQADLTVENLPR